jgi:hypothetical protein
MDTSELPLVKNCIEKSNTFDVAGDKVNSEKWFNLALLAEEYYKKQGYKVIDEILREKYGT